MVRCLYCERSHVSCIMRTWNGPGVEFSGLLRLVRMELRAEGVRVGTFFFACATMKEREMEGRKEGHCCHNEICAETTESTYIPCQSPTPSPHPFYLPTHSVPLFGLRSQSRRVKENHGALDMVTGWLEWTGRIPRTPRMMAALVATGISCRESKGMAITTSPGAPPG